MRLFFEMHNQNLLMYTQAFNMHAWKMCAFDRKSIGNEIRCIKTNAITWIYQRVFSIANWILKNKFNHSVDKNEILFIHAFNWFIISCKVWIPHTGWSEDNTRQTENSVTSQIARKQENKKPIEYMNFQWIGKRLICWCFPFSLHPTLRICHPSRR